VEEEEDEDDDDKLVKGNFASLPISEWQQLKSVLDREFKEKYGMDLPPKFEDNDDKTPLISGAQADDDDPSEMQMSPTKIVRFQEDFKNLNPDGNNKNVERPVVEENSDDRHSSIGDEEDLDGLLSDSLNESELAHLPGHLKSVKLRKATKEVEKSLTDEQKEEEARVRNEQLASILTLMRQQEEKFGENSMEDIEEQLKLYNFY